MRAILMSVAISLAALFVAAPTLAQESGATRTEVQMLSGSGPDDAVPWNFRINSGRRAGEDATIPVPSNWQQHGFGDYQYGYDKGPRVADKGVYKRSFTVPADWRGRSVDIVFDGVMTDALVKVNGREAGPVHQGGFNRFRFDITRLVRFGEANEIEVEVAEASAERPTDVAERHGDYWVFGGIYRPVWLESTPAEALSHVAVDARASGEWTADVTLRSAVTLPRAYVPTATRVTAQIVDAAGKPVGAPASASFIGGAAPRVHLAGRLTDPKLWSAETPNLYHLEVTLYAGDKVIHQTRERFGFRTFEVRADGLFLNGQRILLKGVNRHSFRPDTARAIGRKQADEDIALIKSMNMNAVRMSHYAPEKAFLEAADEAGLYVINELSGWQNAHATENGKKLVRELVERDVNHPSVIIWANGNEGGWNRALDGEFWLYDPQHRTVIHPWDPFGGIDTKHYPRYADLMTRLAGTMPVLPTEFLHALYDGGGGAGLEDYWEAIERSPVGAGAFHWNLADEGIVRTDRGGRIDTYAAFAPDGLVGPRHEKEGSYYTVRDLWSPVQVAPPALTAGGATSLKVRNAYDFTPLTAVRFRWEWVKFAAPGAATTEAALLARGEVEGPNIAPHAEGQLALPAAPAGRGADALRLTALKGDETLLTWVWPTRAAVADTAGRRVGTPAVQTMGDVVRLQAGNVRAEFDAATGALRRLARGDRVETFEHGPQLVVARPSGAAPAWVDASAGADGVYAPPSPMFATTAQITLDAVEADGWNAFVLEISPDGRRWKKVYDSARVLPRDGQTYSFPGQQVAAVRISKLAGVRKTPRVLSVKLAGDAALFAVPQGPVAITTGTGRDAASGRAVAWLEAPGAGGLKTARWTLRDDGELALDYSYALEGSMLYHGVGMDQPADVRSVRALVRGPSAVWQNRMRGPVLGVYDIASPDTAGYFADPQWVRLTSARGVLDVATEGAAFLQLGQRPEDFPTTSEEFPVTTLGFMNAIPAMGAKSQPAEQTGPQGQPRDATGVYTGKLRFRF